jgi:transcriptional regulator with XRE-family HTH domain
MLPSPRLIAAARVLLGLSQAELAQRAGLHVNVVRRFETGRTSPRVSTLEALLKVFAAAGVEFVSGSDRIEGGIILRRSE